MNTKKNLLCSIIIRTKNEEKWINRCLSKIEEQTYKNFEIIIVDNFSEDSTINIVQKFKKKIDIKITYLKNYLPGLALNKGIRKSKGDYICMLSAHCIPKNKNWLKFLVNAIEEKKNIAGVYGRQEPMNFTSNDDKRDLFTVFGLDKKIQIKDSFFHNANSIIKKSCWNEVNFDEKLTNIEDRLWAQEILKKNYILIYDPKPSVFHYHGIHQSKNPQRLSGVIKIFEKKIHKFNAGKIKIKDLNICAIIPVKGKTNNIGKFSQLSLTINKVNSSKYVNDIIVSTDNTYTKNIALKLGAKVPFLRPLRLSKDKINLEKVYQYTLKELEKKNLFYDIYVLLEETFPFRENKLIDNMIENFVFNNLECIVAAKKEFSWIWNKVNNDNYQRLDKGDIPRKLKEFILIGIPGLCLVTLPSVLRKGTSNIPETSFFLVNEKLSHIEIRNKNDIKLFKSHLEEYAHKSTL